MSMIRLQGINNIYQVTEAYVERDGRVCVIPGGQGGLVRGAGQADRLRLVITEKSLV